MLSDLYTAKKELGTTSACAQRASISSAASRNRKDPIMLCSLAAGRGTGLGLSEIIQFYSQSLIFFLFFHSIKFLLVFDFSCQRVSIVISNKNKIGQ